MDDCNETEKLLNDVDFSKDWEEIVWWRIVSRLSKNADSVSSIDLNSIAGGLSDLNSIFKYKK